MHGRKLKNLIRSLSSEVSLNEFVILDEKWSKISSETKIFRWKISSFWLGKTKLAPNFTPWKKRKKSTSKTRVCCVMSRSYVSHYDCSHFGRNVFSSEIGLWWTCTKVGLFRHLFPTVSTLCFGKRRGKHENDCGFVLIWIHFLVDRRSTLNRILVILSSRIGLSCIWKGQHKVFFFYETSKCNMPSNKIF